ncbi:MAG: hypothetical protein NVS1B13_15540 [Flavisolibacter sp.]
MENSFGIPIIPDNEEERMRALQSYEILDSPPEKYFNNFAEIIAKSFNVPIALISLVDKDQVFFKANVGMESSDYVPRGISLCSLAILSLEPTVFEDALKEPCLLANPLVAGNFGLRFYAGSPLITPDGFTIGTVCVVDKIPRDFTPLERDLLTGFANSVMDAIIKRKQAIESQLTI